MYTFRQVIDEMNRGEPFTCTFITYSSKRKKGGRIRDIEAKVIRPEDIVSRPVTEHEEKERSKDQPRHVRNVILLVDGFPTNQVRMINIPLIIKFNGESVVP